MISLETLILIHTAIKQTPKNKRITSASLQKDTGLAYATIRRFLPVFVEMIDSHNIVGTTVVPPSKVGQLSDEMITTLKTMLKSL